MPLEVLLEKETIHVGGDDVSHHLLGFESVILRLHRSDRFMSLCVVSMGAWLWVVSAQSIDLGDQGELLLMLRHLEIGSICDIGDESVEGFCQGFDELGACQFVGLIVMAGGSLRCVVNFLLWDKICMAVLPFCFE